MTLPSGPPLSLSQIQGEFGGVFPANLTEYYAGGGLVPPGTVGVNGPVPSGPPIKISHFYGTENVADRQTVNSGEVSGSYVRTGFSANPASPAGSMVDGTCNMFGGALYYDMAYFRATLGSSRIIEWSVRGDFPNSGWSTLTLTPVSTGVPLVLRRDQATFMPGTDQGGGVIVTGWQWTYTSATTPPNPFVNGQQTSVLFMP